MVFSSFGSLIARGSSLQCQAASPSARRAPLVPGAATEKAALKSGVAHRGWAAGRMQRTPSAHPVDADVKRTPAGHKLDSARAEEAHASLKNV
jgi:hypothetical protein